MPAYGIEALRFIITLKQVPGYESQLEVLKPYDLSSLSNDEYGEDVEMLY